MSRGLIGNAMISEQSGTDIVAPPAGTEVDETRQTANLTGGVLNQVRAWNERKDEDTIHIEVTTLSTSQFEVAFWLFPNHRKGCTMYKWTLFDNGRALQSAFWRNDAAVMRLAGAADLPHDLYPDSVPWMAFMRVLDAPRDGAEGCLISKSRLTAMSAKRFGPGRRKYKRTGRQLLRVQGHRESGHRDHDAELAALRLANHQACNA